MNKEEFETTLESFRAALEEADRLMVEAGVAYVVATDRLKEAKRQYNGHVSWGKAVGFVETKDITDDVVGMVESGPDEIAAELGVTRRAVAGALRRAVNRGLLVRTEGGYARA